MAIPTLRTPFGRVPDNPAPTVGSQIDGGMCLTVPIEWLIQKNKDVYLFLKYYLSAAHMIGGLGMKAHDGMTSVPEHQRSGGIQVAIAETEHAFNLAKSMRKFRKPITVGGEKVFPPEKEYNHISPSSFGPLKTDWNTLCPRSLSEGQKRERCVSLQEAVWGKAVLTRLENIKKKVDPKGVFKCHRCVGGNDPPKYSWDVTYPSCKRGYWHSGCGQPAMKQKGTVKCYGKGPDSVWEADAKYCTGKKPVAERVCPATKPCPRCKGCKRNGACWNTCGKKAGQCSACYSRDGRVGACCRRDATDDPVECQIAEFQFATDKVHTCALLPKGHTGQLLRRIVSRLNDLEADLVDLHKK